MRTLFLTIFLASFMLLPLGVDHASPPQQASGDFQVVSVNVTSVQDVGDTCIIALNATFDFQGTFEGAFDAHFKIVHHGPCSEPAPETFEAQGTYEGTVEGVSGTFDFNFQGSIDAEGNAEGQLVIQKGTSGLAHLRGMLTLTGIAGVGGSYEGEIHFDP